MDGISSLGGLFSFKPKQSKKDKLKQEKTEKGAFSSAVKEAEAEKAATDLGLEVFPEIDSGVPLEELLDSVHELGEKVKKNTQFSVLRQYKRAVQKFLYAVVKKTVIIEETVSGINIMKRKRFSMIKVVDEKLNRLVTGVLQNQRSQLDILRRIDEINGMLVDFFT
ncbi:MAG: DUF327 family protein [Spirochaetia bacterium]